MGGTTNKTMNLILNIISISITIIGNTVLFFMIKHDLKNKRRRDGKINKNRGANQAIIT